MHATPTICFFFCATTFGCTPKDLGDETPSAISADNRDPVAGSTDGNAPDGDDVETGEEAGDANTSADTGLLLTDTGESEVVDGDASTTAPDSIAEAVCLTGDAGERVSITLANSVSEAGLASFALDESNQLLLTMPETGDGFLQVDVPDWMSVVRIFTDQDAAYEVLGGEEGAERLLNGSCPEEGITDHMWYFHEWGSYTIRFDDDGPNEPWLSVYKL